MRNQALRTKFRVGQIVVIPRLIAERFTVKLAPLPEKITGIIVAVEDRFVGRHYRLVVDIQMRETVRQIEVWEEWMLERITVKTDAFNVREEAKLAQVEALRQAMSQAARVWRKLRPCEHRSRKEALRRAIYFRNQAQQAMNSVPL